MQSLLFLYRGSQRGVSKDPPTDPVDMAAFSRGASTDLLIFVEGELVSPPSATWPCQTDEPVDYRRKFSVKPSVSLPVPPPHVLMNFRGFPPGCGDSVANF